MSILPISGYLSDNARTEGEQKDAFEDLRDVMFQRLFNEHAITIVAGSVTPEQAFVRVAPESGTQDDLVTIDASNFEQGQVIILCSDVTQVNRIDVKVTGNIILTGAYGSNLDLDNRNDLVLLRWDGSNWTEYAVHRWLVEDSRSDLGLADSAITPMGPGNGLDADTLDGLEGADLLGVAAKAADSELLDGVDGANYTRKDLGTEQIHTGVLRTNAAILNIQDTISSTPAIKLRDSADATRVELGYNATELEMILYDSDGSTKNSQVRIAPDGYPEAWNKIDTTWAAMIIEGLNDSDYIKKTSLVKKTVSNASGSIPVPGSSEVDLSIFVLAEVGHDFEDVAGWYHSVATSDNGFVTASLIAINPILPSAGRFQWKVNYRLTNGDTSSQNAIITSFIDYNHIG